MQGDGQFDDAETGAQMPAGDRHRTDGVAAQFVGQLFQLFDAQAPGVGGIVDGVQKRRSALDLLAGHGVGPFPLF